MDRLIRPAPPPRIDDYDDGDPYSCIAAGAAEHRLQSNWQHRVRSCFGEDDERLRRLHASDPHQVKGALFDLWMDIRRQGKPNELSDWAARHMEELGYPWLVRYDRDHPE
jgi:hypothetical protein